MYSLALEDYTSMYPNISNPYKSLWYHHHVYTSFPGVFFVVQLITLAGIIISTLKMCQEKGYSSLTDICHSCWNSSYCVVVIVIFQVYRFVIDTYITVSQLSTHCGNVVTTHDQNRSKIHSMVYVKSIIFPCPHCVTLLETGQAGHKARRGHSYWFDGDHKVVGYATSV